MQHVLIDTGPLVAAMNRRDKHHEWAYSLLARLPPPLLTCEAVLAEACFLLQSVHKGDVALLAMIQRGVLQPEFRLGEHASSIARLMAKYEDVPMSLADACLVRMSELYDDCQVATCDGDFHIYRRNGRRTIPLLAPA